MTKSLYEKTFIREWREWRGLSLRELSDKMGSNEDGKPFLSHASIGRIEKQTQPYSQRILEALAKALDCSVIDLLAVDPRRMNDAETMLRRLDAKKRERAVDFLKYLHSSE